MNLYNNITLNLVHNRKILYFLYIYLYSIFLHQLLLACYHLHLPHSALGKQYFHPSPKISK